jgi:polyisoprenoid-binding protein YceI
MKAGRDKYKIAGDLTLHGVTKPITLNMWYRGTVFNPTSKKTTAGIQISVIIKRTDFGIGSKFPATSISDEVLIKADGEFTQDENK